MGEEVGQGRAYAATALGPWYALSLSLSLSLALVGYELITCTLIHVHYAHPTLAEPLEVRMFLLVLRLIYLRARVDLEQK